MTRNSELSTRFAAFAAALVLASISLVASVGPSFAALPIA